LVALTSTLENTDLISLWDLGQNSVRTILAPHRSTILRIAWSPDGTKLATASADTTVHLYDAQTGERLRQLTGNSGVVIDVAWSPDGRQVASAAYDYNVFLWDWQDDTEQQFASSYLNSIAWHPDGTYIVGGASDRRVLLWDVATGQRYEWTGHDAAVSPIAWQPEGKWLASGGQDGQIILWDTTSDDWLTGHIWKQGLDLGEQIWDLAWYGNLLAAAGVNGSVKVWDVMTGINVANYGGHIGAVRAVDWSADGRYIVTAGMTDGTAVVHYANFVDDLLPLAQRQLEQGSRAVDQARCLADSE
ncbi:MAG: WD40 repeat domain-containing protein, partial [Caldilineaceae bacterium]